MVGDSSRHGRCYLLGAIETGVRCTKVIGRTDQVHRVVQRQSLARQSPTPTRQRRKAFAERGVEPVTVGRRITPPTADSDRSVPVSVHSAPQYLDAGHAYLSGDSPLAPAFSHRGSVHGALAGLQSANLGGCH
jgi:hypothetical protein